jgi:hypothetical protein
MRMQHGPVDAEVDAGERKLAAAQLDDIALAHDGQPWAVWKNVVVEWHVQELANVRAEAWIPGMAAAQDPAVEQVLSRLYSHHMRAAILRLKTENRELRRRLIDAEACARFYASGASDAGQRARAVVAVGLPAADAPAAPVRSAPTKQGRRH